MNTINQAERAYKMWQVLTQLARQKREITYKQLSQEIDVHHRAVRFPLHLIQEYCLETQLPGLTVLAVNRSGERGQGFKAYQGDNLREGIREVLSFPCDFDKYCIQRVDGKRIHLPKHKDCFPSPEFVRWRNE